MGKERKLGGPANRREFPNSNADPTCRVSKEFRIEGAPFKKPRLSNRFVPERKLYRFRKNSSRRRRRCTVFEYSSIPENSTLSGVESMCREDDRTWPLRGGKSRNKVSVGEPVEGSLSC
ncbi:hypothetical protein TNCT_679521 [Trichonephila clavata]|uniref:Uncharacterized protein n=1 Tax=Trichonephila clavata TaxID=2740835 RepID=A0A8X6KWF8_TRICU|nr:hypothetical protein TNCT_679521 [Trichonephila clavata]